MILLDSLKRDGEFSGSWGFFLYIKIYDLLSATIYLFIYLLNWFYETRSHICHARLELWCFCFHCPSAGIWGICHHTWTITSSNFSHGIDKDIETRGRGGPTTSDAAYQREGSNLSLGLQRSDLENPVWFTGILALEHQQAREKVIKWSFDAILQDSRHRAQLLEVFENVWVCIQLNFNRG